MADPNRLDVRFIAADHDARRDMRARSCMVAEMCSPRE
jgi:hypothetical protein